MFKLTAKCCCCHKTKVLSEKEIEEAKELGCAMCDCGSPMTIEKAEVSQSSMRKTIISDEIKGGEE